MEGYFGKVPIHSISGNRIASSLAYVCEFLKDSRYNWLQEFLHPNMNALLNPRLILRSMGDTGVR